MADDDVIYKSAAPSLFGDSFCKAKKRGEELKWKNLHVLTELACHHVRSLYCYCNYYCKRYIIVIIIVAEHAHLVYVYTIMCNSF